MAHSNGWAIDYASTLLANNRLVSLEKYVSWLNQNVHYRLDEVSGEWAKPETTVTRGYGDCKDYSVLNKAALRALGHRADIYSVTYSSLGKHSICVFKIQGHYAFISNAELHTTTLSKWPDFEDYLLLEHGYFLPKLVM